MKTKKVENGTRIHESRNANLGRSKAPEATILKAAQKWYKKKAPAPKKCDFFIRSTTHKASCQNNKAVVPAKRKTHTQNICFGLHAYHYFGR